MTLSMLCLNLMRYVIVAGDILCLILFDEIPCYMLKLYNLKQYYFIYICGGFKEITVLIQM